MCTLSMNAAEDTLHIRIPISFKRRSSRKMIVAPDGTSLDEMTDAGQPDQKLVMALAKAYLWQAKLDSGVYPSGKDMARAEKIDVTYMYSVIRLTLLAPDIVEAILAGKQPRTLSLQKIIRGFPISWQEQRKAFGFLERDK